MGDDSLFEGVTLEPLYDPARGSYYVVKGWRYGSHAILAEASSFGIADALQKFWQAQKVSA